VSLWLLWSHDQLLFSDIRFNTLDHTSKPVRSALILGNEVRTCSENKYSFKAFFFVMTVAINRQELSFLTKLKKNLADARSLASGCTWDFLMVTIGKMIGTTHKAKEYQV
jgi:hypothetical protein